MMSITIEEFVIIAGVKQSTIKKNAKRIPGLNYINGEFHIIDGPRYPGNYKKYKLTNSEKRRYVLLKAISEYKYIDHLSLQVYREQFRDLLQELLDAGLIRENGMPNHYGANAYDCTRKGDEIIKRKQNEAIKEISELVSNSAGHFAGAVISEVYPFA